MGKYSLLLKGGTIVTDEESYKSDIGIYRGMIVAIGELSSSDAKEVIDIEGKYVLPGAIDVNTHMDSGLGSSKASDEYFAGTKAAALGGTTSIVDFAIQEKGQTLKETVEIWEDEICRKAVVDYGVHIVITDINESIIDEMEAMVELGYSSFKLIVSDEEENVSDSVLLKVLERAKHLGALIVAHAENNEIIKYLGQRYMDEGKTEPIYHPLSRPSYTELEAVVRVSSLAKATNATVYITNVSSALSVQYIRMLRSAGFPIMAETCPQYLLLDESQYNENKESSLAYIMCPPLRYKAEQVVLWDGLKQGVIQVLSTNHYSIALKKKKEQSKKDFTKISAGIPGIQLRLIHALTQSLKENRLSLQEVAKICSTNPAKIFGMYPNKGTIKITSDADLVVIDPYQTGTISLGMLQENAGYTPYEGTQYQGIPVHVFLRGKKVVYNQQFVGKKGQGSFLKREQCLFI